LEHGQWLVGFSKACEEALKRPRKLAEAVKPTKGLVGYGEK